MVLPRLPVDAAELRARVGGEVFARVSGPDGARRREQIFEAAGERWFAEDRPIRRVHGDSAMFVGGLRALLLQSLHPLAMAGVAAHSDFRADPWGRLQRTSYFLAATTFGPDDEAERAVARVRGVHRRVRGTAPDGRPYAADDPHLLRWVHLAEIDSFLAAYQRYGSAPLTTAEQDGYVLDTGLVAEKLGIDDPPRTMAALGEQLAAYRPELAGTPQARQAARYLLVSAPLPLAARAPYSALAAAAVGLMPVWTRWPLRLPYLPVLEGTVGRLAGWGAVAGIRWATSPADSAGQSAGSAR
ncbi:oxygenase MpaB family protein [Pseudofrankia sp. DC12]|uniref:oxygenase MpaB family protein n=1 Tax=Pseudofrankia sp. DC12 TaxID=683315 RepID=UPI0005F83A3D|nr:oxygenase MpaB family protein [Pseudofrankia sp. DC12]